MLGKILIGILIFIVTILIVAYFVDGKITYEKSITINAPVEKVWTHTSSLAGIDQWSPWNDLDPNMKKTYEGTDGQVGAKQCWEGNKNAGKGCQTISEVQDLRQLTTDINFMKPMNSKARSKIVLQPEGATTKVSWSIASEMPYPFRIMKLVMNMEKSMDEPFQRGLKKLKAISERP